jgi:hypothetical protein
MAYFTVGKSVADGNQNTATYSYSELYKPTTARMMPGKYTLAWLLGHEPVAAEVTRL